MTTNNSTSVDSSEFNSFYVPGVTAVSDSSRPSSAPVTQRSEYQNTVDQPRQQAAGGIDDSEFSDTSVTQDENPAQLPYMERKYYAYAALSKPFPTGAVRDFLKVIRDYNINSIQLAYLMSGMHDVREIDLEEAERQAAKLVGFSQSVIEAKLHLLRSQSALKLSQMLIFLVKDGFDVTYSVVEGPVDWRDNQGRKVDYIRKQPILTLTKGKESIAMNFYDWTFSAETLSYPLPVDSPTYLRLAISVYFVCQVRKRNKKLEHDHGAKAVEAYFKFLDKRDHVKRMIKEVKTRYNQFYKDNLARDPTMFNIDDQAEVIPALAKIFQSRKGKEGAIMGFSPQTYAMASDELPVISSGKWKEMATQNLIQHGYSSYALSTFSSYRQFRANKGFEFKLFDSCFGFIHNGLSTYLKWKLVIAQIALPAGEDVWTVGHDTPDHWRPALPTNSRHFNDVDVGNTIVANLKEVGEMISEAAKRKSGLPKLLISDVQVTSGKYDPNRPKGELGTEDWNEQVPIYELYNQISEHCPVLCKLHPVLTSSESSKAKLISFSGAINYVVGNDRVGAAFVNPTARAYNCEFFIIVAKDIKVLSEVCPRYKEKMLVGHNITIMGKLASAADLADSAEEYLNVKSQLANVERNLRLVTATPFYRMDAQQDVEPWLEMFQRSRKEIDLNEDNALQFEDVSFSNIGPEGSDVDAEGGFFVNTTRPKPGPVVVTSVSTSTSRSDLPPASQKKSTFSFLS